MPDRPSPEAQDPAPAAAAPSRRRRWLPALLLLAAAAVVVPMADELPSDHHVELVAGRGDDVRAVELTWLQGDEVIRRATYSFDSVGAQPVIRADVRATPGEYRLIVTVDRDGARSQKEHRVRLDDEVEMITLPLP